MLTPSCMSISRTWPSRVARAARATSEIARGKRGSGKHSGWYSATSSSRGRSSRCTASSVSVACDSQASGSAMRSLAWVHAGHARVACGCPDRSATVQRLAARCFAMQQPPVQRAGEAEPAGQHRARARPTSGRVGHGDAVQQRGGRRVDVLAEGVGERFEQPAVGGLLVAVAGRLAPPRGWKRNERGRIATLPLRCACRGGCAGVGPGPRALAGLAATPGVLRVAVLLAAVG